MTMDTTWIAKAKSPPERNLGVEPLLAAFNAERMLRERKAIVRLACGHLVYTRSRRAMPCPRCTEMLRRSLRDGSEDYESFRAGLVRDFMEWPDDPCRQFNEPRRPSDDPPAGAETGDAS